MKSNKKRLGMTAIVITFLALLVVASYVKIPQKQEEDRDTEGGQDGIASIVVTYQTLYNSKTEDIDLVLEAVNEISREEIGVEIVLKIDSAQEAFTDYPLWISQGEQVDLMILNYQDITGYISRGMILPLDSLLESYGGGIREIAANRQNLMQGSVINGKTYGVTNVSGMEIAGGGIWISKQLLDEIDIEYDKNHIYTYEELDVIFAKLKERYPDSYPLGQITADATATSFGYYDVLEENIAGTINTGIVADDRICNFYETDDYYQFLLKMREWYEKGYIFPDAAFTDEELPELYSCGKVLSKPISSQPGMAEELCDDTVVCLKTTPVEKTMRTEKSGFWVIPGSSREPEAAMKFLNLMLTDTRIGNLLKWGIEGVHYVKTDSGTEGRSIAYPEGMDEETVGYYNPMALYGDYTKIYSMDSEARTIEIQEYMESAITRSDVYDGFVYDKTSVSDKIAAVEDVVEKYVPILESGSVDLNIYYPEFIEKLNQAGMQEIIADKQAQFDAWREEL